MGGATIFLVKQDIRSGISWEGVKDIFIMLHSERPKCLIYSLLCSSRGQERKRGTGVHKSCA